MARPWMIEQLREAAEKDLANAREKGAPNTVIDGLESLRDKTSELLVEAEKQIRENVRHLLDTKPDILPAHLALEIIRLRLMVDADQLIQDMVMDIVDEHLIEAKATDALADKMAVGEALREGKKILA